MSDYWEEDSYCGLKPGEMDDRVTGRAGRAKVKLRKVLKTYVEKRIAVADLVNQLEATVPELDALQTQIFNLAQDGFSDDAATSVLVELLAEGSYVVRLPNRSKITNYEPNVITVNVAHKIGLTKLEVLAVVPE